MSFPKAPIKRYYDVDNGIPGPGLYDPKNPQDHVLGGVMFDKSRRFPENKENFAIPRTPSCRRATPGHGHSQSRPATTSLNQGKSLKPLRGRKSNSFSLPSGMDQTGVDHAGDDNSFYEVQRNVNIDSLLQEIHAKELEVEEKDAEIRRLVRKNQDLSETLVGAEGRIVELEDTVSKQENEAAKLKETMDKELRENKESAALEVSDLKNANQKLHADVDALQQEVIDLRATLAERTDSEKELQHHLTEVRNALEIVTRDKENITHQFQQATGACNRAKETICCLEQQVQQLEDSLTALNLTNEHLQDTRKQLESALKYIDEQQLKIAQKDNEITGYETRIKSLSRTVCERDGEIKVLEELVSVKEQDIQVLQEEVIQMQGAVAAHQKAYESLSNENICIVTRLENKYDELKNKTEQTEQKLKGQLEKMQSRLSKQEEDFKLQLVALESEKEACESNYHIQLALAETKKTELESNLMTKLQAIEQEKTEMEIRMSETIDCITAQRTKLEAELIQKWQEAEAEKLLIQKQLMESVDRLENEKKLAQAQYAKELDSLKEEKKQKELFFSELVKAAQEDKEKLEKAHGMELYEKAAIESNLNHQIALLETERQRMEADLSERVISLTTEKIKLQEECNARVEIIQNEKHQLGALLNDEITQLKQEIVTISSDLTLSQQNYEAELASKNALIASEQCRITELLQALREIESSANEEKLRYEQESNEYEKRAEDLEMQVAALEIEIERLNHDLNETAKTAEVQACSYSNQLADYELRLNHAREENTVLQTQLSEKEKELESQVQSFHAKELELMSRDDDISKLRNALIEKDILIKTTTDEAQKHLGLNEAYENELEDLKAKLEIADAKIEVTEVEVRELQQQLTQEIRLREQKFAEYEMKVTTGAVEIAELKDKLDMSNCLSNQFESELHDARHKLVAVQDELEMMTAELKQERQNSSNMQLEITENLKKSEAAAKLLETQLSDMKAKYESTCLDKSRQTERLIKYKNKLAEHLDTQLQTYLRHPADAERFAHSLLEQKFKKFQQIVKARMAKSHEKLKELALYSSELKKQLDAKSKLLTRELQYKMKHEEEIMMKVDQIENLKAQNATLENLIGPFREQLKLYKTNLDLEQGTTAKYAEYAADLESRCAKMMGHQNLKQRILHLQKLKDDKLNLLTENQQLRKDLSLKEKRISDLEGKLMKVSRRFDPSDAFKHPMKEQRQYAEQKENNPSNF